MKPIVAFTLLAGCASPAPVAVNLPGPVLLEVVEVWEECSGAGGAHIIFAALDALGDGPLVHHGGHAVHFDPTFAVGDLVGSVDQVEVNMEPTAGWCIEDMSLVPWYTPTVTRFADEGEARAWLRAQ